MSAAPALQLVPEPPRDGDRLLGIADVQALFPSGARSRAWVRTHFAPEHRLKMGHHVYWWRRDALRWIASHMEGKR